ncbi:exodeoxyribonuclease VII large subunit [Candidatus Curtissbacteria bacterium RIFCSPLOWO2_01_FULL_42_26]|uniref:Exodeoxyribonuclease 7 large subunit n=1 Tax=Candidatus Curtissbacteria bacterium RIFCSPLOWO2_01_FULL_42_26 TaxID=1797729 RepID=A0A1F5I385_9BACT|nr:MAG: exodeoxyribonuclease VII large subunit [Candidatus Curtissbacteria bacterium RIFCSPLOWO2_01_FULL_42_26]
MKTVEGKTVYTVSEVNSIVRQNLETLSFWIEGEISGFKGPNQHYRYLYFDLKDPQTGFKIACIAEPEIYNENFAFDNGQMVLALGNITLWEKEGRLQLYVLKIQNFGQGYLLAKLEQLKAKLEKKGYFDISRKKKLTPFPTNIAVISSWVSDAWQDFKKHSVDMFPIIKVTFFDVTVQGQNSATKIKKALDKADSMNFDAIALIRGGGSIEDLAAFNNEDLALKIYKCKSCIVVGVGHEKDVTIAALVADINASTPTDAAKIIASDYMHLESKLIQAKASILKLVAGIAFSQSQTCDILYHKLSRAKDRYMAVPNHLNFLKNSLKISEETIVRANTQNLLIYKNSLKSNWLRIFTENKDKLINLKKQINLLSPDSTMKRGYSIAYNNRGQVIKDVKHIDVAATIKVQLWRGKLKSKVIAKEN